MTTLLAESVAIISDVRVSEGDAVSAGTVLLVTELMKMQHEILADIDGAVASAMAVHRAVAGESNKSNYTGDDAEIFTF